MTSPTVGILYAGEMGTAIGKLLRQSGVAVVTTGAGRSADTARRAEAAGLDVLPSLEDVAARADVVLSLVPPAAALDAAKDYRAAAPLGRTACFVDLNSIAPMTAGRIAELLAGSALDFVDGAIHGLASRLPERGTVYLSGPQAPDVAELLGRVFRVKVLGDAVGQASAFKMLIAGLNKGLSALFLEMALAARHDGLLDELLTCYRDAYPGVMDVVDRTVPTYPRHARRRADEMREAEETFRHLGLEPCLVSATRAFLEAMGRLDLGDAPGGWTVPDVIEALHKHEMLRRT